MESNVVRSIGEAESVARRADEGRLVYWYDVPLELAESTGVRSVGLVELTSGEELMAGRRATSAVQLAYELAKECLRHSDDALLSTADGSLDAWWARRTPGMSQLRALVVTAYGQIHQPKTPDTEAFLSSRRAVAR
jgi:hypothetical protein